MTAREKHRHYRTLIDAPSVLIAAAALAMWMLWPEIDRVSGPRELPAPKVFSTHTTQEDANPALSPDLFALPSPMGFTGLDVRRGMPDIPRAAQHRPPRFLERQRTGTEEEHVLTGSSHVLPNAGAPLSDYIHRPDNEPVYEQPKSPEMRLIVDPMGFLAKYGFSAPPVADEDIQYLDKAWMVSLKVYVGEDGGVDHVFIENGCDDSRINDMVVRMVSKGKLAQPGRKCSGRVTVNFGAW